MGLFVYLAIWDHLPDNHLAVKGWYWLIVINCDFWVTILLYILTFNLDFSKIFQRINVIMSIINDYKKSYMHVFYIHKYFNDVIIYTLLVSNINIWINNLNLV